MENPKRLIKKTNSDIRNQMSLELELEELITEGSINFEEEVVQKYNPKIHEACEHVPIQIMYEKNKNTIRIKNINKIKEAVNKSKAKGYILGPPIFFNIPADKGPMLIATIPINFYKLKE